MSMLHDVGRGGDGERDYETFTGQTRCGLHHTQLGVSTSILSRSSTVENEVAWKSVTGESGPLFFHRVWRVFQSLMIRSPRVIILDQNRRVMAMPAGFVEPSVCQAR